MTTEQIKPTKEDAQSLANKLVEFTKSLSPAERALWQRRLQEAAAQGSDVQGYDWQLMWVEDYWGNWFLEWVWVDDEYYY